MKTAYIWDLDGTLLDSYAVIVESLYQTIKETGMSLSRDAIHQHAISFSSSSLIEQVATQLKIDPESLYARYSQLSREKYHLIRLMPNALEILNALKERGAEHYVFTHRGRTTVPVLEHLNMDGYFREVLTSQSGFARKPSPDAIVYLIGKYGLSRDSAFYVGDRRLDMESAKNAGIPGILYLPKDSRGAPSGAESYIVRDLMEILDIK